MKPICLITVLALLCTGAPVIASPSPGRADMVGTVLGHDGKPIPSATVFVYTAAPKQGVSVLCPSCYIDCGKRTQTDASGRFQIPSVDDTLTYRLLVLAKEHESKFVPKVDPSAGPVKVLLNQRDLAATDSRRRIAGLVIGEDGAPIAGAAISPEGVELGNSTRWGGITRSVEPLAVTDEAGRFLLVCREEADSIYATVEGIGFAQRWITLKPGRDHLVRVQEGGRL